jgi:hypothetical protein
MKVASSTQDTRLSGSSSQPAPWGNGQYVVILALVPSHRGRSAADSAVQAERPLAGLAVPLPGNRVALSQSVSSAFL